ncbi:hypothetical protein DFH08DRAFT_821686 [Mycena albidolilacea]|uniref:Uncharacterized protein n=1 Tax=Mycena albidolilacea TaxID=1033008 RepID=A0AAD6ZA15_9AGAR|nr:hypothetical protein DFH08DRAFT_821686 [Mycena albidolilacea]
MSELESHTANVVGGPKHAGVGPPRKYQQCAIRQGGRYKGKRRVRREGEREGKRKRKRKGEMNEDEVEPGEGESWQQQWVDLGDVRVLEEVVVKDEVVKAGNGRRDEDGEEMRSSAHPIPHLERDVHGTHVALIDPVGDTQTGVGGAQRGAPGLVVPPSNSVVKSGLGGVGSQTKEGVRGKPSKVTMPLCCMPPPNTPPDTSHHPNGHHPPTRSTTQLWSDATYRPRPEKPKAVKRQQKELKSCAKIHELKFSAN